jgi:hypothetical protein
MMLEAPTEDVIHEPAAVPTPDDALVRDVPQGASLPVGE